MFYAIAFQEGLDLATIKLSLIVRRMGHRESVTTKHFLQLIYYYS